MSSVFDLSSDESEDEMYGGVHVDGFLKPIESHKGWGPGIISRPPSLDRGESQSSTDLPSASNDGDSGSLNEGDDSGSDQSDAEMGDA